jgi:hypothetical protein
MRPRELRSAALALAFVVLGAASASGRDGGTRAAASAAPRASAAPAAPAGALPPGHPPTGSLPPGHPPTDPGDDEGDDDQELPPGHPPPTQQRGPSAQQQPLPEDISEVDKTLPMGTIVIEVRDAQERPIPRADVTLGILQQSVAKGESRRKVPKQADDEGNLRFDELESGGGVAYRVTVPWGATAGGEGATYAAPPFQLDLHHGQRVRVHVYPVTSRINEAMLAMDGIVYMELKDDVVQFEELYRVYNLGPVTWVPSDVVVTLPAGFKGFNAQKEMSDTGWDEVPGKGARLHGTFSPGQHETHFRYQVPYSGDEAIEFSKTLPPRVARMRVMAEASKGMTLKVRDFPDSEWDKNQAGQRILFTMRQPRSGEMLPTDLQMTLGNIPTEGSAKWVATSIAAATIVLGIWLALEQEKAKSGGKKRMANPDAERARSRLVTEIAELDKAHASGDVGPKAYERIRAALIDALARLMATA